MIFECLKLDMDVTDDKFNFIYPERIQKLANRHFTPIAIAKKAAGFLAHKPEAKILDIGSGAGKFCLIGAALTKGDFTGVEQRDYLYHLSNNILHCYHLPNVKFIHSNITQIKFTDYNAFYCFNPFYENLDTSAIIDNTVKTGFEMYNLYTQYVQEQLSQLPVGTRLATYFADLKAIPNQYCSLFSDYEGRLKF